MARLAAERLNDIREAINLWNQVLAIAERDPDALAGLATLYERERRWPALVEILERQRRERPRRRRRRAGAARAARHAALREAGRDRRRPSTSSGASRRCSRQNARATRAARDLRAVGRLRGAGVAVRRAGRLRGSVRSADLAGRPDRPTWRRARACWNGSPRWRSRSSTSRSARSRPTSASWRPIRTTARAALALVPLYRTAQKWPRLLATYEALLGPAAAGRRASG